MLAAVRWSATRLSSAGTTQRRRITLGDTGPNLERALLSIVFVASTVCTVALNDDIYKTVGIAGPLISVKSVNRNQDLFPMLTADYSCPALFKSRKLPSPWPPPKHIPMDLYSEYTMGNRIPVSYSYFAQKYAGSDALHGLWTREEVQKYVFKTRALIRGSRRYGIKSTLEVAATLAAWRNAINGRHVGVFGSERPWLEGMLLGFGAAHITTVEYGEIKSQDERVSTITPTAISAMFETGNLSMTAQFDAVFSYSSLEHAGLGRYGDPLNPYGDFEAVAQVSCLLKPGGIFFLGFGIGQDKIEWNAHRIYGKTRLPFVTANFRLLDIVGDFDWGKAAWNKQPILVLQNTFGCSNENSACERPTDIPRVPIDNMGKRKKKPARIRGV